MKKILMIYSDYLFKNDIRFIASTGRFISLGQIFQRAGYEVVIASYSSVNNECYSEIRDGMKIHYLEKPKFNKIKDFLKTGSDFCNELSKIENISEFEAVIYYGTTLKFTSSINKMAIKNNILSISITNEWGNYKFKQTPSYLLQKLGILYVTKNYDGVISISKFMDDYFTKHKVNSTVIPSIFDFDKLPKNKLNNMDEKITISYAGTISNGKDSMAVVLESISLLEEPLINKVQFNLYGSSKEQVENVLGERSDDILSKLSNQLVFKGHYERTKLQNELIDSDFTILIRPDKPYANAGFPTKFAESLALGVPVIANATSDISTYLKTDYNGVLVKNDTLKEISKSIEAALSYNAKERIQLKKNAFDSAKKSFNYLSYVDQLKEFMEEIKSEKSSK